MDLIRAYEHLTAIAQILRGPEAKAPKAWRDRLEAGDIDRLFRQAGKHLPTSAQSKRAVLKHPSTRYRICEKEYLDTKRERERQAR